MKLSSSMSDVPKEFGTLPSTPNSPLPPAELPSTGERGKKIPKPRSFCSKSGMYLRRNLDLHMYILKVIISF